MTTFTGTSGVDTADASGPTLTGFTTGVAADLTDANDDTFDCQGGADVIDAGTTNDTLIGGGGADDLNGGGGSDTYQFNSGDFRQRRVRSTTRASSGTDTIELIGNATVIDFTVGTVPTSRPCSLTTSRLPSSIKSQLPDKPHRDRSR